MGGKDRLSRLAGGLRDDTDSKKDEKRNSIIRFFVRRTRESRGSSSMGKYTIFGRRGCAASSRL